jgi:hypothetical protein
MPNPTATRLVTINVTLAVYVADDANAIQALDDVLTDLDRAATRTDANGVTRVVVGADLDEATVTSLT